MQHVEFVLPALQVSTAIIHRKLVPLLQAWQATARVTVHAYSAGMERNYFFNHREIKAAKIDYERKVQQWCDELEETLNEVSPDHEFSIIWERDLEKHWQEAKPGHKGSLLVLVMPQPEMRQSYRSIIRHTDTPILALFDTPWRRPLKIAAAIDPSHEDERDAGRDVRVVRNAIAVAKGLSASASVIHSCFVPGYLRDYKKKLVGIHRQNLNEFMVDHGVSHIPHTLLQGDPAAAVRKFVTENQIGILALGSVARGILDRYVLGSTAEEILSEPPCDLLLLRS